MKRYIRSSLDLDTTTIIRQLKGMLVPVDRILTEYESRYDIQVDENIYEPTSANLIKLWYEMSRLGDVNHDSLYGAFGTDIELVSLTLRKDKDYILEVRLLDDVLDVYPLTIENNVILNIKSINIDISKFKASIGSFIKKLQNYFYTMNTSGDNMIAHHDTYPDYEEVSSSIKKYCITPMNRILSRYGHGPVKLVENSIRYNEEMVDDDLDTLYYVYDFMGEGHRIAGYYSFVQDIVGDWVPSSEILDIDWWPELEDYADAVGFKFD